VTHLNVFLKEGNSDSVAVQRRLFDKRAKSSYVIPVAIKKTQAFPFNPQNPIFAP